MKRKHFPLVGLLSALLLILPGLALAQVKVHLSQNRIELGQMLQISFEVTGQAASPPDLSPLQQDFDILNRSFRQQSSTINGRRSQTLVLTLSLAPRRSGKLQVPSLDFGGTRSPARSIEVLAAAGQDAPNAWSGRQPELPPFRTPAVDQNSQLLEPAPVWPGGQEPWSGFGSSAPALEVVPPAASGYQQAPLYGRFPPEADPTASPPTGPPATEFQVPERFLQRPQQGAGGYSSYSQWLAGAATGVVLTLLLTYLRKRRRQRPAAEPARTRAAPTPQPTLVEDPAVRALRRAFEHGDAAGARQVLLRWARDVWPDQPPANLSRLAMRMPASARDAILKLDQAQYSPTPIPWKDLDASELLQRPDNTPAPAASSLRRRAAR